VILAEEGSSRLKSAAGFKNREAQVRDGIESREGGGTVGCVAIPEAELGWARQMPLLWWVDKSNPNERGLEFWF